MSGKPNDKWLETMIKKHGSREAVREIMGNIGTKGGSKTGIIKGFAANPELASRVGTIGGLKSRRPKKEL